MAPSRKRKAPVDDDLASSPAAPPPPPEQVRKIRGIRPIKQVEVAAEAGIATETAQEETVQQAASSEIQTSEVTSIDNSTDVVESSAAEKAASRLEKFKALQARAKKSADRNRKEVLAERNRLAADPRSSSRLAAAATSAQQKLLKDDLGADEFERRRAWDWTVDEAAKWDTLQAQRAAKKADAEFADHTQNARKTYVRQVEQEKILANPNLEEYRKEKEAALIKSGNVREDAETGELVVVDTHGDWFADGQGLEAFNSAAPKKENVDRLVKQMEKDDARRIKRAKRMGNEDDVTYINDDNKRFNVKLARHYNKYTQDIRDSFERGTMI